MLGIGTFINKLASNMANRKDPKFLIVLGTEVKHQQKYGFDMVFVKLKELDNQKIIYHRCNSVMFMKHKSRELQKLNVVHYVVERW